jgi:hypothetical protein
MNPDEIIVRINKRKVVSGNILPVIFLEEAADLIAAENWRVLFRIAKQVVWSQIPFVGAIILIYNAFKMSPENVQQEMSKFLAGVDLRDRMTAVNLNAAEELLSLPRDILYELSGRED